MKDEWQVMCLCYPHVSDQRITLLLLYLGYLLSTHVFPVKKI
jgi:hypothetical protein